MIYCASVVYDGSTQLLEGETAEARFIKIQAAYELLMDRDERRQYDLDHRSNPLKVVVVLAEELVLLGCGLSSLLLTLYVLGIGIEIMDGMGYQEEEGV